MNTILIGVITFLAGIIVGLYLAGIVIREKLRYDKKQSNIKNETIVLLTNWTSILGTDVKLARYLKDKGCGKIAIYGMAELGVLLYDALQDTDVEIMYLVDKNACHMKFKIPVYTLEDELPQVDTIIVTPFQFYDVIATDLRKVCTCPILSLKDIMSELSAKEGYEY